MMMMQPPHIKVQLDPTDPLKNIGPLVDALRPQWKGQELQQTRVVGGNANTNIKVFTNETHEKHDALFLHIIHPLILEMDKNMVPNIHRVVRLLNEHKLGPSLYCTYENGTCIEFLYGHDLDPVRTTGGVNQLLTPELRRLSARDLAKLHCKSLYEAAEKQGVMTNLIFMYMDLLEMYWPMVHNDDKLTQSQKDELPDKDSMKSEFQSIFAMIEKVGCDVRLCHADYNPSNIMKLEDGSVCSVDFDNCCISFSPYDIAYFHLFTFNSHDTPGDGIQGPDPEYNKSWCRDYLERRQELDGGQPVTDYDVQKLVYQVAKVTPLLLLRTTCSSTMMGVKTDQTQHSDHFIQFGILCWREYLKLKDAASSLTFSEKT